MDSNKPEFAPLSCDGFWWSLDAEGARKRAEFCDRMAELAETDEPHIVEDKS